MEAEEAAQREEQRQQREERERQDKEAKRRELEAEMLERRRVEREDMEREERARIAAERLRQEELQVLSLLALLVQKYKYRSASALPQSAGGRRSCRCSVYSLYWYKSTNTDAGGARSGSRCCSGRNASG